MQLSVVIVAGEFNFQPQLFVPDIRLSVNGGRARGFEFVYGRQSFLFIEINLACSFRMLPSHLTTLSNDHILDWLVARFRCACVLDLVNDIEAIDYLTKNDMLVV